MTASDKGLRVNHGKQTVAQPSTVHRTFAELDRMKMVERGLYGRILVCEHTLPHWVWRTVTNAASVCAGHMGFPKNLPLGHKNVPTSSGLRAMPKRDGSRW